jgi:hypothetical protein
MQVVPPGFAQLQHAQALAECSELCAALLLLYGQHAVRCPADRFVLLLERLASGLFRSASPHADVQQGSRDSLVTAQGLVSAALPSGRGFCMTGFGAI